MGKKTKISSTAYRVIYLMKLLNNNGHTIDELNEQFAKDINIARNFSKEVILKYMSTIKSAGYEIIRSNRPKGYLYKLAKAPTPIDISREEIKTLVEIETYIKSLYQENLIKGFSNFIEKIVRYMDEEQISILNSTRKDNIAILKETSNRYSKYAELIKQFEKFCAEDQRVIIKYKFPADEMQKQIIFEPKNIKYDANDVYISGYNFITCEKQLLHLSNIEEVKQLPIKSKLNYILSPIIYKLKGRVAKGYRVYEDEKIASLDPEAGTVTIAVYVDDKNMLLQRLLKYGEHCEVLYQKAVREKMVSILNESIENYSNPK